MVSDFCVPKLARGYIQRQFLEVAHVLNVSVRTVRTIIGSKRPTYSRGGGQLCLDPLHLDQYLQKRPVARAAFDRGHEYTFDCLHRLRECEPGYRLGISRGGYTTRGMEAVW